MIFYFKQFYLSIEYENKDKKQIFKYWRILGFRESFDQYGQVLTRMGKNGQVLTRMGKNGQVLKSIDFASFDKNGQVLTSIDKNGQVLKSIDFASFDMNGHLLTKFG